MARIRTIKPEFFTSEDVCALSPLARLLFVALWCEADREGRMAYKPVTFKLRYLPADDCDVEALCNELIDQGLLIPYEADGKAYAEITSFTKHQVINNRESESQIPARATPGTTRQARVTDASGTRESGRERKGKEGKGTEGKGERADGAKRATVLPDDFRPNETNERIAREKGVCLEDELAKFADYCRANRKTYVDHHAALNNWLRNAKDFQRGKTSGPPGGSHETPRERAIRMAREQGIPYDPQ